MPTDILINPATGDLMIRNGDFVVGNSTLQHQRHLLQARPGDIKQSPLVGVDAISELDEEGTDGLLRSIRKTFVRDGMTVNDLSVGSDGKISVDANY